MGKPTPLEIRSAAVAAYLDGDSANTIADELGVSAPAVINWVRAAGYTPRPRGVTPGTPRAARAIPHPVREAVERDRAARGVWVVRRGIRVLVHDAKASTHVR